MDTLISQITICYNSDKTIRRTFDSVLCQTYLPFEYIVVDGGSTDDTIRIITEYERRFNDQNVIFKWISEKDRGLYDAMNKGAHLATGTWLHFLNSDDYYLNNYSIESVVHYLRKTKADVVYGNLLKGNMFTQTYMIGVPDNKLKMNMLLSCPIQQPATLYKRILFAKYSFDIQYKISADYKLFVEMIQDHEKFEFVPVYITFFSLGGISSLHTHDLTMNEDIRLLKEAKLTTFFMRLKGIRLLYKPLILIFQLLSKI